MTRRYVRVDSVVWCDFHGAVHPRETDYYESNERDCAPRNWRNLMVLADTDEAGSF